MDRPRMIMVAMLALLAGCRQEPAEVSIETTRELTTRDAAPKLFATSDERFQNARPSPLAADPPPGWEALPATEFRLLNYRFGPDGRGEVYVTVASGSMLDNVNRWFGQFGAPGIDRAALSALRRVRVLGGQGTWVEAAGTYRGAAGRPGEEGFALAGVVADLGGRLVTVKMVGPEKVVEAEKEALETFVATLRARE